MLFPLLVVLASAAAPQSWKFDTDGTPQVHVSNVDGAVRVDAVDGNSVVIEAVPENPDSGRKATEVEVTQEGDDIRARVCCGPCEERRQSCKGVSPVRFVVKVPREAALEVSVVNAAVTVQGVKGEQRMSAVDGRVEVNGSERRLSVSTVKGEVVLAPRKLEGVEISTVSGDVRLKLPERADAKVEFSSVGGSFNGKSVSLGSKTRTYGAGTHEVEVSTVGGSLTVQE
ncbi:hypothetical protein MYSTI_03488 [Myxococcus stipitatus DSM 14675]|uniref:DUF4097 domain-containing protein n=1 Tax=Myxococcus stipitatus (strain DSM 14675 / JCM 12634 / Mx s8) TaxID=1278073 RepID=L7UA93_MYXSD|nr:DUF4097 family beta strand repeat-containing protein [Myxococcus stipitatus]AGC44800.1 hypothetical protein MYSTI_03488 [Myxococcus stipitatus DSM 14675]